MLILMPQAPPVMNTESTIVYDFRNGSGSATSDLSAALKRNFHIERKNFELDSVIAQLNELSQWPNNWNGYDALAPSTQAIAHARLFIRQMYVNAMATTALWKEPHITADANGGVVFEWWNDEKKLTIYLLSYVAEYVQVWGPDIQNQMAEGEIDSTAAGRKLWLWLTG